TDAARPAYAARAALRIHRHGRQPTMTTREALGPIVAALAAAILAAACDAPAGVEEHGPLLDGEMFVAIHRDVGGDEVARRTAELGIAGAELARSVDEDFYLAIHEDAFDERWFLTATIQQLSPGGPAQGAAQTL